MREPEERVLVVRVPEERVSLVVPEVLVALEPRDSLVERVGVVLRVSVVPRVSDVPRVVVPRVSEVSRASDVPRVVVPRVSEVLRVSDVPRVVVPRDSEVLRVVEGSVVVPPRVPPEVWAEGVALPLLWLLLTCVPVVGLWSRVASGVFTVGRLLPGVHTPVGMGAGALGWRM